MIPVPCQRCRSTYRLTCDLVVIVIHIHIMILLLPVMPVSVYSVTSDAVSIRCYHAVMSVSNYNNRVNDASVYYTVLYIPVLPVPIYSVT